MTAAQFKNACQKLGISVYACADVLDMSVRQVYAYSRGEVPIPKLVAIAMRAMVRLGTIDV
jgi:hypothetical protein